MSLTSWVLDNLPVPQGLKKETKCTNDPESGGAIHMYVHKMKILFKNCTEVTFPYFET